MLSLHTSRASLTIITSLLIVNRKNQSIYTALLTKTSTNDAKMVNKQTKMSTLIKGADKKAAIVTDYTSANKLTVTKINGFLSYKLKMSKLKRSTDDFGFKRKYIYG